MVPAVGPGHGRLAVVTAEVGIGPDSVLEQFVVVAGPVQAYCNRMLHLGLLQPVRAVSSQSVAAG